MMADASQLSQLLARAAQGGDECTYDLAIEAALARLMLLTRRMLRRYPSLRRWEQSDDVLQEAAIRLFRSLKDVQPLSTADFFGLAALQIRRTVIDLLRHHFGPQGEAARHRSDPFLFVRHDGGPVDPSGDPQSLAEWGAFHEAVDTLPDEERAIFELVYYVGSTYAEAAAILGVARRTAIRRMNRARLLLAPHVVASAKVNAEP